MRIVAIAACSVLVASIASAHVTVLPRESHASAEQRYTVRVPTEGQVATTAVELEIPVGVVVGEVVAGAGHTFDVRREGGRIVAITWTREIPPKQSAEFVFVARNPNAAEIVWKAHQRFADGTSAAWVGAAGSPQPASVTRIVVAAR
jgi:uncharacterized protein YcnI